LCSGFLQDNSPNAFPLLLERVVYNGMHSGDWIAAGDVPRLISESRKIAGLGELRLCASGFSTFEGS